MLELNLEGLKCPLPLMRLEKFLAKMSIGDCVEIRTTDENAPLDFAVYCELHGHSILKEEVVPLGEALDVTIMIIQKHQKISSNSL